MSASDLAIVQGITHTRATLDVWNERPWPVIGRWFAGSLAIAALLLTAVWVVASTTTADSTPFTFPGLATEPTLGQVGEVLLRNGLVLALHAMACVAGYIAGSSLPVAAQRHRGVWRWVHDKAGPLAILFVAAATAFSLLTQSLVLGLGAGALAAQLEVSNALLVVGLLPHALPELVALFLPLAAWIIASRRGDWHELLAATVVTVMLAVPILFAAAFVEVYVSPGLLRSLAG
ncbi:MAG: stage II sporulation protein M [Solirubrobacteraceae bacterium]